MTEQEKMMHKVQTYCFAGVDVGMFLDSHPKNPAALAYYRNNNQLYKKAVADYEAMYGPLFMRNNTSNDEWKWTADPWPWEGAHD